MNNYTKSIISDMMTKYQLKLQPNLAGKDRAPTALSSVGATRPVLNWSQSDQNTKHTQDHPILARNLLLLLWTSQTIILCRGLFWLSVAVRQGGLLGLRTCRHCRCYHHLHNPDPGLGTLPLWPMCRALFFGER